MSVINRHYGTTVAEPTAETRAGLPMQYMVPAAPTMGERVGNALFDYGPLPAKMATNVLLQPVHAGEAVGKAIVDPSIPTIANAGFQTGLALFQPAKALGALGAGYGAGVLNDLGVFNAAKPASAFADTFDDQMSKAREISAGIRTRHAAEAAAEEKRWDKSGLGPKAKMDARSALAAKHAEELRPLNEQIAELGRAQAAKFGSEEQARIAKEKAMMDTATAEKAKALSRDKRWQDSTAGQVWEETGGLAPFIAAAGLGAAARVGRGASPDQWSKAMKYGAAEGGVINHLPLAYDYVNAPSVNPRLEAEEAFAREAPDGPERVRAQREAERLRSVQPTNPVKDNARNDLYDPLKIVERTAIGAGEGAMGGLLGNAVAAAPGRLIEGAAALPGRAAAGEQRGMAAALVEEAKAAKAQAGVLAERGGAYAAEADAASAAGRAATERMTRDTALANERAAAEALAQREAAAAQREAAAAQKAAAEAEVLNRSGSGMGGQQSAGPSPTQAGQPPQPATVPNPATSNFPPPVGTNIAPATGGNQALDLRGFGQELGRALADAHVQGAVEFRNAVQQIGTEVRALADAGKISQAEVATLREDLMRQIEAIKSQPPPVPPPVPPQPPRNFPPAAGPGPYIEGGSQPYARAVIDDMIKNGEPLGPKKGAEVMRRIQAAAPPNVTPTKDADVRARLKNTIDQIGLRPTAEQWETLKERVPLGTDTLGRNKMFAIPAAVGAGAGMNALFSDGADASPAPRNALMSDPRLGPGPRLAPEAPRHHSHDQPRRRDGTFK